MTETLRVLAGDRDATREELILELLEQRLENARLRERLRVAEGTGYARLGRKERA